MPVAAMRRAGTITNPSAPRNPRVRVSGVRSVSINLHDWKPLWTWHEKASTWWDGVC